MTEPSPASPTSRTRETKRLRLSRWTLDDVDDFARVFAVEETMRFSNVGRGLTFEESEKTVQIFMADWEENGWGNWAIRLKDTGEFIGYTGLRIPKFLPQILPAVEVGYRFHPDHWGRGYATEAAAQSLRFGFDELGFERIVAIYEPANVKSGAVMVRLGMRKERETTIPKEDSLVYVYEITREAWASGEQRRVDL